MIQISPDVARLLHTILLQQSVAVNTENFPEVASLVSRALDELAPAVEVAPEPEEAVEVPA